MIFCQLRSINSYRLIPDLSAESMLDMVEIIVKWLQVSVSKCNWQTSHTKNPTCVQGLGSERPSDLYDRFQRELLLHKKKVLSQRWLRSLRFERITSHVTNVIYTQNWLSIMMHSNFYYHSYLIRDGLDDPGRHLSVVCRSHVSLTRFTIGDDIREELSIREYADRTISSCNIWLQTAQKWE